MPYADISQDDQGLAYRLARRVLISGPPNSGKTTSLRTWCQEGKRCAIVSFPGELGIASLPQGNGVVNFAWGEIDVTKPVNWLEMVEQTRRLMADLIVGKHGMLDVLAGDGLHKLYWCYLNMQSGGAAARGETFESLKVYPATNALFFGDLRRWLQAPIPYSVYTLWVGRDRDEPGLGAGPSHIFPALPGQAGQNVVGEFTLCLYAERQGTGPAARYLWLTQPDSRVWGVGAKLPLDVAQRLPASVPQDWQRLEPLVTLPPVPPPPQPSSLPSEPPPAA